MILDFFPFDLLFSRFVNTRFELLPLEFIQNMTHFLQTVRLQFLPIHQGWQILRTNPGSPANRTFFKLAEAVLRQRKRDEGVLNILVREAERLTGHVTVKSDPKD